MELGTAQCGTVRTVAGRYVRAKEAMGNRSGCPIHDGVDDGCEEGALEGKEQGDNEG